MAKEEVSIEKRIKFIKVDSNKDTMKLADLLLQGEMLAIDFNSCDQQVAQQIVCFLSGVNYATDGEIRKLDKNKFFFALKENLRDSEVKEFLRKYTVK